MRYASSLVLGLLVGLGAAASSFAQPEATPKPAGKGAKSLADARREPGAPNDREGRGPGPGGRGGFGGPGGPGGFMGPERAILKQFDKDNNGRLDQAERQAARAFLKTQPARGPGGPGGRGFNPGAMMAKPLLEALDADQDGKLSGDEVAAGVKKFVAEADLAKDATLDQPKVAEALNKILPPPPMFGGRGGFGGGPGGPGGGPPGGAPRRDTEGRPPLESDAKTETDAKKNRREPAPAAPQNPPAPRGGDRPAGGRPGGFGGGFGPGGFGPGNMIAGSIVQRADKNKDGKLTTEELQFAGQSLFKEADKDKDGLLAETEVIAAIGLMVPTGPGGFGPPGGGNREKGKPGPRVAVSDVKAYGDEPLYAADVLRTLFFEFEDTDWEAELAEFHNTDVEVPATLTVDGKKYPDVGITFRGMSSYGMVPAGSKRSLNVSIDFADGKQRLLGYKTLNLLNAHEDPSFLSTVLYSHIARKHIPAPKANFVKVVINGESWGIYANVQQFNKEFLAENYSNAKGTRWKVRGSPGGGGGLEYFGDDLEDYKRRYQMKTDDSDKAWKEFVTLCKTLNETPPEELEAALKPILEIDQTLWFLALDVALINNDGYWVRASDYSIFRDAKGQFHIIPHDMNEAFHGAMMMGGRGPGGPGGRGGPRGGELELDPLVGLDDPGKPLRSKLLA
ncbi:MAG: CotH protein, partial [Planctomycetaceae bacterium]|nr:CotH protein [Planctomycetaceae bacterium]